ncbi:MAG: M20/M25/M40 family metallo-hydrolase, partial [Spirochaetaceae bacterium]|nr:M20/M25/M40 family metallo-hydrolase [Spirochaetaceae bacterium]
MIGPAIPEAELGDLLRRLIRIDSCNPPGREAPVAEFLGGWLREAGLEVELDRFAAGRANVVARWRGNGDEPALLFNGHLDTVPVEREQWRHDPHAAVVEGGVLHGRGTVDMKGGVAALAMACAALARAGVRLQRDLIFAGTAGEEVDCCGSQRLAAGDLGPGGAPGVGEATRPRVGAGPQGGAWPR